MTTPANPSAANRFVSLDGLRGIAAMAVVACHVPALFSYTFPHTDLAVDFFFALSGFVIAHAYGERLKGGMSANRFMLLRLIRLYPLYLLGTVIGLSFAAAKMAPPEYVVPLEWLPLAVPSSLLMLPIFVGVINFPFDGPAWSLFFEMIANGGYALFHRQLAKPVWLISGIAVFAALLALAIHKFGSVSLGWQADKHALGGLARVGYSFLAGLGVYKLHTRWPLRLSFPPTLLALALLAVVLSPFNVHHGAYDLACILVVLPLLLYVGAGLTPGRREGQVFSLLGGISYAVYATHGPIAFALEGLYEGKLALHFTVHKLLLGLAFMTFAGLLGYAANRWYDEPVRKVLNRWERSRAKLAPQAVRA